MYEQNQGNPTREGESPWGQQHPEGFTNPRPKETEEEAIILA